MALTGSLGTFHHPGVSRIDYKPLDMDRVLTALLARLWHHGMPSKISRTATLDVDVFVKLFLDHPEVFDGYDGGDHHPLDRHPPHGHGQPRPGRRSCGRPQAAARLHLPVPQQPQIPPLRG